MAEGADPFRLGRFAWAVSAGTVVDRDRRTDESDRPRRPRDALTGLLVPEPGSTWPLIGVRPRLAGYR